MIILLDAMGGDNAPDANIKGAVAAVNQVDAEIWLIGKEDVIKNKLKEFYNKRRKSFDDVVGDSSIRPNQLFAIGLHYPVVDSSSEEAKNAFETVTKKLLTPYGLKTLAKGEKCYREIYEGDQIKRDMSYHQGITWPWLLGIYSDSFLNIINAEKNKTKKKGKNRNGCDKIWF